MIGPPVAARVYFAFPVRTPDGEVIDYVKVDWDKMDSIELIREIVAFDDDGVEVGRG